MVYHTRLKTALTGANLISIPHFLAKRLNDPSDSYLFRINNGSIGQQGENTGEIDLMSKPKEGTVVQQGLNKGTLAFTDKGR